MVFLKNSLKTRPATARLSRACWSVTSAENRRNRPSYTAEKAEPEAFWIRMGSCTGGSKNLVPLGAHIPSGNNAAAFRIEGLTGEEATRSPRSVPL
ncbi:MAG: hypothetical protein NC245_17085 [Muribaculum sp.]|nr:hypothetical protein [Muribaculum sp.]